MLKTIPRYLHFCYLGDKKAPYIASRSWQLRPDKDLQKAFDLIYRNTICFVLCKVGASLKFVKVVKAINNAAKILCGRVVKYQTF